MYGRKKILDRKKKIGTFAIPAKKRENKFGATCVQLEKRHPEFIHMEKNDKIEKGLQNRKKKN